MKQKKNILIFAAIFIISLVSCAKPGDTFIQQGITAFSKGDYDKALELFNQAMESDTRYSEELILNFIANVYAAQEDFENSSACLEKALATKPDYRGFVTLGMNYQMLGQFNKAEQSYFKAIEMNADKGEAYASLGALYLEQNQNEKAVSYLEKGASLEPKIAVIHGNLALAWAKLGNKEKYLEEIKKAEELQCVNLGQFEEKAKTYLPDIR